MKKIPSFLHSSLCLTKNCSLISFTPEEVLYVTSYLEGHAYMRTRVHAHRNTLTLTADTHVCAHFYIRERKIHKKFALELYSKNFPKKIPQGYFTDKSHEES